MPICLLEMETRSLAQVSSYVVLRLNTLSFSGEKIPDKGLGRTSIETFNTSQ